MFSPTLRQPHPRVEGAALHGAAAGAELSQDYMPLARMRLSPREGLGAWAGWWPPAGAPH